MRFLESSLGNYFPAESVVHRLDPRLKIGALILLMAATFLVVSPVAVGVHTAAVLGVVAAARIPLRVFIRGLRLFIWLFAVTAVLHLFFTPGTPIYDEPVLGFINVTEEGLLRGGLISWRLLVVIALSALLTGTTTPLEITRGLESLLAPMSRLKFPVQDFSLMMMIALRFIPVLADETQRVWKAQRSRGADLGRGSARKRGRTLMSVLLPVFTGLFRRADELALALESRGYVPGQPRTSMKRLAWERQDWLGAMIVLGWTFVVAYLGAMPGGTV